MLNEEDAQESHRRDVEDAERNTEVGEQVTRRKREVKHAASLF
jgi:hypothetical protein